MNIFILSMSIFITIVCVIELLSYAFRTIKNPERVKLKKRLKKLSSTTKANAGILRSESLSSIPLLNKILAFIPGFKKLEGLRKKADASYPLGVFILMSLTLGFAAYATITICCPQFPLAFAGIPIAVLLPWAYLKRKKKIRMALFQKQLPEALDLIARSLRAGHSFSAGLKLASEQFDNPVGAEFATVIDEVNFGISVQRALRNLARRINTQEVKFFVLAVIMQRETGGNLAEIMEGNAKLIRERFIFYKHVRTLTAEGRGSGVILVLMPFIVAGLMYILKPEYVTLLFTEHVGRVMLSVAGIMMFLGIIAIKKLVNIKI